jgi:hypothetical protein
VRLTFCDVGSNSHEVLEFYREYAFDKIQGLFKDFGKLGVMLRSNSINSYLPVLTYWTLAFSEILFTISYL